MDDRSDSDIILREMGKDSKKNEKEVEESPDKW
jgi:hypothetical protein